MRIISGSLKGKKLFSLPGKNIRPTSGRIKESIFNILPSLDRKTMVLDLFAGTGSLSLEALSRGAAHAVLIDNAKASINVIYRNLIACRFKEHSRVIAWDIVMNLNCLMRLPRTFNLIFMDPPYGKNMTGPTLSNLIQSHSLAQNARIIIEHSLKEPLQNLPARIAVSDERRYGKTLVSFLRYMV
jgi:16S rRNA (guanine966-N2)-methyltransferase